MLTKDTIIKKRRRKSIGLPLLDECRNKHKQIPRKRWRYQQADEDHEAVGLFYSREFYWMSLCINC
jgi:hypothetical protein